MELVARRGTGHTGARLAGALGIAAGFALLAVLARIVLPFGSRRRTAPKSFAPAPPAAAVSQPEPVAAPAPLAEEEPAAAEPEPEPVAAEPEPEPQASSVDFLGVSPDNSTLDGKERVAGEPAAAPEPEPEPATPFMWTPAAVPAPAPIPAPEPAPVVESLQMFHWSPGPHLPGTAA